MDKKYKGLLMALQSLLYPPPISTCLSPVFTSESCVPFSLGNEVLTGITSHPICIFPERQSSRPSSYMLVKR